MWNMAKVARGYLELLVGRNSGRTPLTVSDELRPTLEMREFYASSMLLCTSGNPTVGSMAAELSDSLGFTTTLGLRALGASLTIGAAAATNITMTVGMHFGTTFVPIHSIFIAGAAAGATVHCGIPTPGWILPAGSTLQAHVHGTAAGADHSLDVHGLIENYTQLA